MTDIVEQLRDGAKSDWAKRTRLDIWAAFTKFVDFGQKREWNAADVLIEAADEIKRLRSDAARYRWLRDRHHNGDRIWHVLGVRWSEDLDADIDEAMRDEL